MIEQPLNVEELRELAQRVGGIAAIVSKRSPAYKGYVQQIQDEADWLEAMAKEPRLIRRPIWFVNGHHRIGFDVDAWKSAIEGHQNP
ncbi:MAG: arsenate reductase [Sulfobacillus thermotolerans]|nr:arsenate reductase [Sulfobacillus thermotolerans]